MAQSQEQLLAHLAVELAERRSEILTLEISVLRLTEENIRLRQAIAQLSGDEPDVSPNGHSHVHHSDGAGVPS